MFLGNIISDSEDEPPPDDFDISDLDDVLDNYEYSSKEWNKKIDVACSGYDLLDIVARIKILYHLLRQIL